MPAEAGVPGAAGQPAGVPAAAAAAVPGATWQQPAAVRAGCPGVPAAASDAGLRDVRRSRPMVPGETQQTML